MQVPKFLVYPMDLQTEKSTIEKKELKKSKLQMIGVQPFRRDLNKLYSDFIEDDQDSAKHHHDLNPKGGKNGKARFYYEPNPALGKDAEAKIQRPKATKGAQGQLAQAVRMLIKSWVH